jgi:hypothetical protein
MVKLSPTAPDTVAGDTVKACVPPELTATEIGMATPNESLTETVAEPEAKPLIASTPPLTVAVDTAVLLLVAVYGDTPPPTV